MRLIVTIDGNQPSTVIINDEVFIIGRSPKSSMQIVSDSVSRSHLKVRSSQNVIYVTDLGSANGTFIDGEKLTPDQEVVWPTFFPISLGEKVSLFFEEATQENNDDVEEKTIVRTLERKSTSTPKTEKAPAKNKTAIAEKNNKGVKHLYIGIILMAGMGYFFYHYYKDKDFQETDLSHTPKKTKQAAPASVAVSNSQHLVQVPRTLQSVMKCQSEQEKLFCGLVKSNPEYAEGVIQKENDLFIYVNFGTRIKNVEMDPSFSMASDQDRMTYLMSNTAFREEIREAIKPIGITNIFIVDISSGPTRVNQVMKVTQLNLMKLTRIDIEIAFSGVLNKDPKFFNTLVLPLIEMGYAK